MSGGSGSAQPSQTTTFKPSKQQMELYNLAKPGILEWSATVPERYGGSTIAPFDPLQVAGQNLALGAAGSQAGLSEGAVNANQFLMGDIWNPASNPYLTGAIDAAVRPITQKYQEVVRPNIRDEFAQAGQQFGGSERIGAEARAGADYLSQVGDTSSKLVQDQYGNNLTAMLRALALAPQTQGTTLAPAQTVSGIGDIRQAFAQALLGEDVGNYYYDENAKYLQSKELLALMAGLPGGSVQSTANNPPQAPLWQRSLGGAASGASAGSMFGPFGAVAGGGLGAILPFLSG